MIKKTSECYKCTLLFHEETCGGCSINLSKLLFYFIGVSIIVITKPPTDRLTVEPSTRQNVEGNICTRFLVRVQSAIRIVADYVINSTETVEPITSWYYHSTVNGTRTRLNFRLSFLPDGRIGRVVTNPPWGTNSSWTIIRLVDLRQEILEISAVFPVHEGFYTFKVSQ